MVKRRMRLPELVAADGTEWLIESRLWDRRGGFGGTFPQSGEEKPVDLLGEVLNGSGRECGYPGKGRRFIDELQKNKKYKREM